MTAFDGIYNYNSLQATVSKQLSHGITFQASYTYSKNLTTLAGYGANYNLPTNLGQQYGPSTFNRPQRLAFNYSWDLPLRANGIAGKLVSGWTISGLTVFQDGTPLTITDTRAGSIYGVSGGSPTNPGIPGSNVVGRAQLCPGVTYNDIATSGGVESRLGGSSGGGYFSTSAFCAPPTIGNGFDYGNSGVGIILGPGQMNWDFSVVKLTKVGGIHEDATLQFRAESFNAFNHAQFNNPTVIRHQRVVRADHQHQRQSAPDSVRAQVHFLGAYLPTTTRLAPARDGTPAFVFWVAHPRQSRENRIGGPP